MRTAVLFKKYHWTLSITSIDVNIVFTINNKQISAYVCKVLHRIQFNTSSLCIIVNLDFHSNIIESISFATFIKISVWFGSASLPSPWHDNCLAISGDSVRNQCTCLLLTPVFRLWLSDSEKIKCPSFAKHQPEKNHKGADGLIFFLLWN